MALRSPSYLDFETLTAQAEYHGVDVPMTADVVEKTVRERTAGGRAGASGFGFSGAVGKNVEFQTSYTMTPSTKATVSKVIDALIGDGVVKQQPGDETPLSKDDLVELEGVSRVTAASLAGKMFHIIRRVLRESTTEIEDLADLKISDPVIAEQLKRVYLQNELLPVPILLELTRTNLGVKAYVNVRPSHFVDEASADRIEGEMRILGSVTGLVPEGNDGYLSAEQWLLDGYEYLFRRKLMLDIDGAVKELVKQFELDLPTDDVHAYITGPAVVVDAIAIY